MNVGSLGAATAQSLRQLSSLGRQTERSLTRLATGRAGEAQTAPAAMIAAEQLAAALAELDAQSRSLDRQDAVASTAQGALAEMTGLRRDAETIDVQLANEAGLTDGERAALELEQSALNAAAMRVANTTTFNDRPLLDGTMTLRVADQSLTLADARPLDSSQLATEQGRVSSFRRHAIGSRRDALAVASENLTAARSTLTDADPVAEAGNLQRLRALGLMAMAALGQLEENRGAVLDLLG